MHAAVGLMLECLLLQFSNPQPCWLQVAEWRLGSVNSWNVKTQATVLYPWPNVNVHPVKGAAGPSAGNDVMEEDQSEEEEGVQQPRLSSPIQRHAEHAAQVKRCHNLQRLLLYWLVGGGSWQLKSVCICPAAHTCSAGHRG